MDDLLYRARAVPRLEAEGEGAQAHRDHHAGLDPFADVEADANAATARRWTQPDRYGESARDVSARSAPRGLAVLGAGTGSRAAGRTEASPAQAARCDARGRGGRDGVRVATQRPRKMERGASDGGSEATRHREEGGTRDDPTSVRRPRAEAVAGKKCGAYRSWTASTSRKWRTC